MTLSAEVNWLIHGVARIEREADRIRLALSRASDLEKEC
jgi:hypothetical protein